MHWVLLHRMSMWRLWHRMTVRLLQWLPVRLLHRLPWHGRLTRLRRVNRNLVVRGYRWLACVEFMLGRNTTRRHTGTVQLLTGQIGVGLILVVRWKRWRRILKVLVRSEIPPQRLLGVLAFVTPRQVVWWKGPIWRERQRLQ